MGSDFLGKVQARASCNTAVFFPIHQSIVSWDYSATKKTTHGAPCVCVTNSCQKSIPHCRAAGWWAVKPQASTCSAVFLSYREAKKVLEEPNPRNRDVFRGGCEIPLCEVAAFVSLGWKESCRH